MQIALAVICRRNKGTFFFFFCFLLLVRSSRKFQDFHTKNMAGTLYQTESLSRINYALFIFSYYHV